MWISHSYKRCGNFSGTFVGVVVQVDFFYHPKHGTALCRGPEVSRPENYLKSMRILTHFRDEKCTDNTDILNIEPTTPTLMTNSVINN